MLTDNKFIRMQYCRRQCTLTGERRTISAAIQKYCRWRCDAICICHGLLSLVVTVELTEPIYFNVKCRVHEHTHAQRQREKMDFHFYTHSMQCNRPLPLPSPNALVFQSKCVHMHCTYTQKHIAHRIHQPGKKHRKKIREKKFDQGSERARKFFKTITNRHV